MPYRAESLQTDVMLACCNPLESYLYINHITLCCIDTAAHVLNQPLCAAVFSAIRYVRMMSMTRIMQIWSCVQVTLP